MQGLLQAVAVGEEIDEDNDEDDIAQGQVEACLENDDDSDDDNDDDDDDFREGVPDGSLRLDCTSVISLSCARHDPEPARALSHYAGRPRG